MEAHWYFVGNARTGQCCDVVAASPQAACDSRGWMLSDCLVIRVGSIRRPGFKRPSALTDPETASASTDPAGAQARIERINPGKLPA